MEVVGHARVADRLGAGEIEQLCALAFACVGVHDGHVAVSFVEAEEMRRLNREHRGRDRATDVLSFPVDGPGPSAGPRELGDVVVCPLQTADLAEAVLHGALHLAGFDHERDEGEMLVVQRELLSWRRR